MLTQRSGAVERTQVGGLVLNHLGWARVLGISAGIFGKMGDDRHGEFLRTGMDRFGIVRHLTLDGSASSFANVSGRSGGSFDVSPTASFDPINWWLFVLEADSMPVPSAMPWGRIRCRS